MRGLGAFVFNFAIPPYVFRLMATTDLAAITEWGFLGGYLLARRRWCSRPAPASAGCCSAWASRR